MISKVMFITAGLFVFVLAYLLLKPFRLHVKRPYSTALLKISYLIYLAVALVFTYEFMFYNGEKVLYLEDINDPRATLHFIMVMLSLFFPNAAILLRRNIQKRQYFNPAASVVNIACMLYYLYLIYKI